MPIQGRTSKECFDSFASHVRGLVSDVLGPRLHVTISQGPDPRRKDMQLGHVGCEYVPLETEAGKKVFFSLAQALVVVPNNAGFQLKTQKYWYKVFDVQPDLDDEPLFRWEYLSEVPPGEMWCKHHFQIGKTSTASGPRRAITLALGEQQLDLNRVHIPTGFMLMEYVFRFLITELNVVKLDGWEARLAESEAMFFSQFSPKTSKA